MIAIAVVSLFYFQFWMQLPTRTQWLFGVAFALFIGGAIGMELVGGYYHTTQGNRDFTYQLISTGEEFLEMAGVIVFIYALLVYIQTELGGIIIGFGKPSEDTLLNRQGVLNSSEQALP